MRTVQSGQNCICLFLKYRPPQLRRVEASREKRKRRMTLILTGLDKVWQGYLRHDPGPACVRRVLVHTKILISVAMCERDLLGECKSASMPFSKAFSLVCPQPTFTRNTRATAHIVRLPTWSNTGAINSCSEATNELTLGMPCLTHSRAQANFRRLSPVIGGSMDRIPSSSCGL